MIRFENFDPESFLREHWQRKPLLIRGALPDFEDPLDPSELAGLAMEDEVDARIVETLPDGWGFRQGPFANNEFDAPCPWTLLVQKADHYLDEIGQLRALVDFLPGWRFDDVMVSYAEPGAGVGPHYDNYDVFLLQGRGSRKWRLGQVCGDDAPLLDHPQLRILEQFEDSAEYTLGPGDVLYVPPRLAHWGTAETKSLTYSLGFRAPRLNDMISRWIAPALERMNPELLYRDPTLQTQRPGEITEQALTAAQEQLLQQLNTLDNNSAWFGELVTDNAEDLVALEINDGDEVRLEPAARLAWRETGSGLEIYANGETVQADGKHRLPIQKLCDGETVIVERELDTELALRLSQQGCLRPSDMEG